MEFDFVFMVEIQRVVVDSYDSYFDRHILRLPLRDLRGESFENVFYDLSNSSDDFKPALLWPVNNKQYLAVASSDYGLGLPNYPLFFENELKVNGIGIVRNTRRFIGKIGLLESIDQERIEKMKDYVGGFSDYIVVGGFSHRHEYTRRGWVGPEAQSPTLAVVVGYESWISGNNWFFLN